MDFDLSTHIMTFYSCQSFIAQLAFPAFQLDGLFFGDRFYGGGFYSFPIIFETFPFFERHHSPIIWRELRHLHPD